MNNLSSKSSNEEKIIKKQNQPNKKTRYTTERQNIINKLNTLIGINETKNSIFFV